MKVAVLINEKTQCFGCQNQFIVPAGDADIEPHCPFCQSPLGLATASDMLEKMTGLKLLGMVDWQAPGKVYVVEQRNEKLLMTLLEEGSTIYSMWKHTRDNGQADPYQSTAIGTDMDRHPSLFHTFPVVWKGSVAIAMADFMDGKQLGEWLHAVGPISVADAVGLVLECLRGCRHLGDTIHAGQIHPNSIQVCENGQVKITAFAGVMWTVFRDPDVRLKSRRSLEAMQRDLKRLTRFSSGGYRAPEFDEEHFKTDRYSGEQCRIQNVYCLGTLLFELLAHHQVPTISLGKHLVKNMELKSAAELRPDAPSQLSTILRKMMAYDPVDRHQTYDEVIAELEGLQIASERMSFVRRAEPPADSAKIAAFNKLQWSHRVRHCDFRKVTWGMTHDEVKEVEADNLSRVMPVAIFVNTEYKGLELHVTYQFLMDGDKTVCVGAGLMPSTMDFKLPQGPSTTLNIEDLTARIAQIDGGNFEDEIAKLIAERSPSFESIEADAKASIKSRKLDVNKLKDTHGAMKELISIEYGVPAIEDGPLREDLEYLELIASSDGLNKEEVMLFCQTSVWETARTYASLSITPGPLGSRQLVAKFWSLTHEHLFPGGKY